MIDKIKLTKENIKPKFTTINNNQNINTNNYNKEAIEPEEIDLFKISNNQTQNEVANYIKINLESNRKKSNKFNRELYQRLKEQLSQLTQEERGFHHER